MTPVKNVKAFQITVNNCSLCGKIAQECVDGRKTFGTKFQRFFINLRRFVRCQNNQSLRSLNHAGCCLKCVSLVEGFLEKYHRWKVMELQLEWQIQQIAQRLENVDTGNGTHDSFADFRSATLELCENRQRYTHPRVAVRKVRFSEQSSSKIHQPEKGELLNGLTEQNWLLTLAAVTLLGKGTPLRIDVPTDLLQEICEYLDIDTNIDLQSKNGKDDFVDSPTASESDLDDKQNEQNLEPDQIPETESADNRFAERDVASPAHSEAEILELCDIIEYQKESETKLEISETDNESGRHGKDEDEYDDYTSTTSTDSDEEHEPNLSKSNTALENVSSANEQYRCHFCATDFQNVLSLLIHEENVHLPPNEASEQNSNPTFRCPRCSYKTDKREDYVLHFACEHFHVPVPISCASLLQAVSDKLTPEASVSRTPWMASLKSREICQLKSQPKKTQEKRTSDKLSHTKISLRTPRALAKYQQIHGRFKCRFCAKEFSYAPDLPVHELTHVTEQNDTKQNSVFPCSRCQAEFITGQELSRHFSSAHLNIGWHLAKCPICQMPLEQVNPKVCQHIFAIHGVKSLDEAPPPDSVRCDVCPAFFRKKFPRKLLYHKFEIHWNSKCPKCPFYPPAGSRQIASLIAHLTRRHPDLLPADLSFTCTSNKCNIRCSSRKAFNAHVKNFHLTDHAPAEIPDDSAITNSQQRTVN